MTFPLILNPLFQMTAAFVLFFAAFITLFAFGILCAAVGWALYRCTDRLAILIAQSRQTTLPFTAEADASGTETASQSLVDRSYWRNACPDSDVAEMRRPSARSRPVAG
jgi:hypothetical protein